MIKHLLIALLFLFLIKGHLFAQTEDLEDYNVANIPPALKNKAGAVIRNMATIVDMQTPDNVIQHVKKVVTVLNKNADERAAMAIFYNKSTQIISIKGLILDALGKPSGKFSQKNFTDESAVSNFSLFEDARIKRYVPNAINYPYTVIYEYDIRYKQNLIIPDWYANPYPDEAVEQNSYIFICRPEDKLHIKAYNFKGKADVTKGEKSITYTWKVNAITAFKREPFAPDEDSYLSYVKIAPEQFTYDGYKGSYTNWEELGKWVYDRLLADRQTLGPETKQEIDLLLKGITDDKEKAKKIYDYIQKKTRYISIQIGIGGFRPFTAESVHRTGYGDCKALVNYTSALLKLAGIPSYYCVVYGGNFKKSLDTGFASMDQGNHIILCIPFKRDTTWLECTSQDTPFGYLGKFTDDRLVLACTAEGGKILKTPALTTKESLLKRTATLKLGEEGDLNGNMQTELYGAQYDNYEEMVHEPYPEQLKLLKEEYDIDNIDFSELKLSQRKDANPVTSMSFKLSIPKFTSRTGDRIYLVLNAFNKTRSIPEVRNRSLPVYVNTGFTDDDEVIYQLPDNFTIEAKPDDRAFNTPFGSYSFSIKNDGNKLIYKRKLVLNNGTYPAEQYSAFADFITTVSSLDNSKVIFKTK